MAKEECAECKVLEDPENLYIVDNEGKLCLSCTLDKLVFRSPNVDWIILDSHSPQFLKERLRKPHGWDKELKVPSNNAFLTIPYIILLFEHPRKLEIGQTVWV